MWRLWADVDETHIYRDNKKMDIYLRALCTCHLPSEEHLLICSIEKFSYFIIVSLYEFVSSQQYKRVHTCNVDV